MTLVQAFMWLCAIANATFATINCVLMIKGKRNLREVERLKDDDVALVARMKGSLEDFTQRILAGEVIAEGDDGRVGQIKVEPVGEHGLRISIVETEDEVTH